MRLIDADALLARIRKDPLFPIVERYGVSGVIDAEPTVDAVPVVRCKDCKHHEDESPGMVYCPDQVGGWVRDDFFCADGERRDDAGRDN